MRNGIKILAAAILGPVAAVTLLLAGCALREFGQAPEDTTAYLGLPYFTNGTFRNQDGEKLSHYPDRIRGGKGAGWMRFILPNANAPANPLPMVIPGKDAFTQAPEDLAVWWLGHSSLIVDLGGKRLLIDPVLDNAAPVPFMVRRYGPAPLEREALPPPDYVLLTHDHYDHMEYATMRHFRDSETLFIVPLGVSAHLVKWGIPQARIHELGWGDVFRDAGLSITAERALHYSGRTFSTRGASLWASYILQGGGKRIFLSGDSGYSGHFRAIGEQYGPFDLAFFEIDGWNPGWPKTHLFPEEVIRACHDVRATVMVPTHWGVFDLALHPWDESIRMLADLVDKDGGITLLSPLMGQKLVPGQTAVSRWWERR